MERGEKRKTEGGWREEGGDGRLFCPLIGVEVCLGWVVLSAGVEGWGDRHGRTPGYPQTWRERGREGANWVLDFILWVRQCYIREMCLCVYFPPLNKDAIRTLTVCVCVYLFLNTLHQRPLGAL